MTEKKETEWHIGCGKGSLPPYDYHVWFKGSRKPVYMFGFSEQHIKDQCEGKTPIKIKRIKEKKEKETRAEPLGPKGAEVGRPGDYELAFEILRDWVDSQGGPPEDVRKAIREHWVDYRRVEKKNDR